MPRTVTPPPATNTHVQVALTAIAAGLPEAISHKVPANPEQFVPIPVDRILPQLAAGQVVMTAAELRECAPDYFSALAGHDTIEVTLPLGDIVKQLSAEHFERRDQRRVDVPAEVTPVFAPGTGGVSVARAVTPQAASIRRPQPTMTATTPSPLSAPVQAPPSKIPVSPQTLAALNGRASTPVAVPTRPAVVPRPAGPAASPAPGLGRAPAAVVPKKPAAAPKPSGHLKVPLASVCPDWIDEVRAQLVDVDVAQSNILVPLELLEPAMKSGRVLFSWQEVASWIQPPLAIPPTPKVGEMPVELSLKVLAPLFMAHHRVGAQKRITISDAIPDLFAGGDSSAMVQTQIASAASAPVAPVAPAASAAPATPVVPVVPAAPVAPHTTAAVPTAAVSHMTAAVPAPAVPLRMTAPVAQPEPVRAVSMARAAAAHSSAPSVAIEHIIGEVTARLGAKEIVANAAKLPGVSGALLAMTDGLLVTSQAPATCKAEMIAAFLPQMFGRMNQYTRELGLGPLDRLALSVESGDWQIFKAPNVYFAVLGKRGEALPLNLLAQIAAELSSQSQ